MLVQIVLDDDALDLIEWVDHVTLYVRSFTSDEIVYTITLEDNDNEYGAMKECSCLDFVQRGVVCKHMYLVNRMHGVHLPTGYLSALLAPVANNELAQSEHQSHNTLFEESLARYKCCKYLFNVLILLIL